MDYVRCLHNEKLVGKCKILGMSAKNQAADLCR